MNSWDSSTKSIAKISPATAQSLVRRTVTDRRRRTAGLCAAGAGATIIGLLMAPVAHADAGDEYGDLSTIYGDMVQAAQFWGSSEEAAFFSDLASPGNIISATGFAHGDPFATGATASADLSTTEAEVTTTSGELTTAENTIFGEIPPGYEPTYQSDQVLALNDTLTLQQQITSDIGSLPTITAQDETNPLVIADLSALDVNETAFDNSLVNLVDAVGIGNAAEMAQVDANLVAEGLGIVNDLQNTAETLTILADLSSIGL